MARTLAEWLDYIEGIHPSGWELGLERIGVVAERLNLREPAPVSVIVAGTNGKGSTCVCLEQILIASGLTVGCALSPHVHRFNERVRINGEELDDQSLCAAFEVIETGRGDTQLTYFEFTALATLYCCKEALVDVAVLEIGLGGRLDAFNIVDASVAVITNIGIDHTDWLGDTREQIGAEKAGVLRSGQTIILGNDPPVSVLEPATEMARILLRAGTDIRCARQPDDNWRLNFKGRDIADLPVRNLPIANCALAIAAADAVLAARITLDGRTLPSDQAVCSSNGPDAHTSDKKPVGKEGGKRAESIERDRYPPMEEAGMAETVADSMGPASRPELSSTLSERAIRTGLHKAWLPGRCEEFSGWGRRWLVDVAHNPLGARIPARRIGAQIPGHANCRPVRNVERQGCGRFARSARRDG